MPFGKNRSSFNPALREKFVAFVNRLQEIDIQFFSKDFRKLKIGGLRGSDFVYCDPPQQTNLQKYLSLSEISLITVGEVYISHLYS